MLITPERSAEDIAPVVKNSDDIEAARPKVRKRLPVVNKDYKLGKYNWHRLRRIIHGLCFVIFVSLPFFDLVRFDIPRARFYFAGFELWINEFAIIFFSLLFLMFVITAAAMLYGRVYCGYLCPQMIFSEAAINLEERTRTFIAKYFAKQTPRFRNWLSRIVTYLAIGLGSVFLAFVFISYFVEPRDLFWRLISLDVITAGGFAGAVVTLITFADFAFLRQRFCTTVCPYGYLQGILGDNNTLVVRYNDPDHICIECTKCVRVCHMGIDIRDSPYQIECIHCGECVDACKLIMGKFGKDTLIHYAWGEKGEAFGTRKGKWYQRLGIRDTKRFAVIAIILVYASSLGIALTLRHNVLVNIAADRATLYRIEGDRVKNTFRMTLANRGRTDSIVSLSINGLPNAEFSLPSSEIHLAAGTELKQEFEISVPADSLSQQVNHFEIRSSVQPDSMEQVDNVTFIFPVENK